MFFNFVSTLDGRAALDGSTRPLGGPADLEMLLSLRAVADAVLIGPGTVRAEGYGRLVGPPRRADVPPAVLISRRFDIPWEAGLFAAADQPVIVYGPADAPEPPDVAAPVEVVRLDAVHARRRARRPARARHPRAAERGRADALPRLPRRRLRRRAVPDAHAADHRRRGRDRDRLRRAARRTPRGWRLRWVLRAEDELFLRYAIVR